MSKVNFNKNDFCKLVGKNFSVKELEEKLPMMAAAWEGTKGNNIEVEIFPDRPDMLSVEGMTRAFSGFVGIKKGLQKYKVNKSRYLVKVDNSVRRLRPHVVFAVIKGVKMTGDFIVSLMQLQEKLHATHCRKRKKASIGVYDLDKIKFPVRYVGIKYGKFIPLEFTQSLDLKDILKKHPKGRKYGHLLTEDRYPVFVDSNGQILSMPPIINSETCKVNKNTKNLFIDVTGMDIKTITKVLNIVVCNIAERFGKIYSVNISYGKKKLITPDLTPSKIKLSLNYVNKLLGLGLKKSQVKTLLSKMRLSADDNLNVLVPAYRTDVMHPIDLVEDVAIAYGYDKFVPELPEISTIGEERPLEIYIRKVRDVVSGFSMQEVLTFIMNNKENLFDKMGLKSKTIVETLNPKTETYTVCRNWLLPSLMEVLGNNQHNEFPQKIFEVGTCVIGDKKTDSGTRDIKKMAICVSHDNANLTEIKSLVNGIMESLGLSYSVKPIKHPSFIETRCASIVLGKKQIGFFGEIHPKILENWKIEKPVVAIEIDVEELSNPAK